MQNYAEGTWQREKNGLSHSSQEADSICKRKRRQKDHEGETRGRILQRRDEREGLTREESEEGF